MMRCTTPHLLYFTHGRKENNINELNTQTKINNNTKLIILNTFKSGEYRVT